MRTVLLFLAVIIAAVFILVAWLFVGCAARVGSRVSLGALSSVPWSSPADSFLDTSLTSTHVANAPLVVKSPNGMITLRRAGTEVSVKAHIKATTPERAAAVSINAVRDGNTNSLTIDSTWPGGKPLSNEGVDFVVTLPDASNITLDSGNGMIAATGFDCPLTADTGNGRVEIVDHAGGLVVRSGNGKVVLSNIQGACEASSGNGDVEAQALHGSLKAASGNGHLDIALADDAAGPVNLATGNGRVELMVGKAFAGTLTASTGSGKIKVDVPGATLATNGGRKVWTMPGAGAGAASKIVTGNGKITVRVNDMTMPAGVR